MSALPVDHVIPTQFFEQTYLGWRSGVAAVVTVKPEGRPLPLRLDLVNHSPTGFEWGYAGSGPAQLALALLAHATGNDEQAVAHHQAFKFAFVANWPRSQGWKITASEVRAWVTSIEAALIAGATLPPTHPSKRI